MELRDLPLIDQIKLQARVLVPLIKVLQAELGQERAHALVRQALGAQYRKLGERWWRQQGARSLGEKLAQSFEQFAAGDALDYQIVRQDAEAFDVNVTGCRYARFYQELGVPELGFLLVCSADLAMAEGYGAGADAEGAGASAGVRLTRTQTIMQGASHCDFRYELKREGSPP